MAQLHGHAEKETETYELAFYKPDNDADNGPT